MRKKNIQRLVIAAVLLIVLPFVISQFMLECLSLQTTSSFSLLPFAQLIVPDRSRRFRTGILRAKGKQEHIMRYTPANLILIANCRYSNFVTTRLNTRSSKSSS